MLEDVQSLCPPLYAFAYSYTNSSADGMQQGDTLHPLLFCLLLHQHSLQLKSEIYALYLNDTTAWNCQDNIQVMREAVDLGLTLNARKCEIISSNMTTCGTLLVSLPGAQVVPSSRVQLLGSPIDDNPCISAVLTLRRLGERLRFLSAKNALILLRNSFPLPSLCSSSICFRSATLVAYDCCLREILALVTNTLLERDSLATMDAILLMKLGRLGIRSTVSVTPPLSWPLLTSQLSLLMPYQISPFSQPG